MGFGWFFGSFSERRFAAMSHIAELGRTEGGESSKEGERGKKREKGEREKNKKRGKEKKKDKEEGNGKRKGKKGKGKQRGGRKKRGRKGNYLEGEKCLEQQMRWKIGKEKLCRFGE